MSKTCPNCKKIYMKEKNHFNIDKTRKDGLSFYCKYCNRNIVAYYEEKRKAPKIKKYVHIQNAIILLKQEWKEKGFVAIAAIVKIIKKEKA